MKKQIIIATLALGAIAFGTINANAQSTEATTTVNIILNDVISIDAGSVAIGGAVDFNYATAADYNTVSNAIVPQSLVITSTKAFDIDVKANAASFINGSNLIPVDVLYIKPITGGTTTMGGTLTTVNLSTTNQKLVDEAPLGSAIILDLDYEIPAAKSSSADILGKPAGTYTQTITFTASVD